MKEILPTQRVYVARQRGNDELAPSEDLFHDFDQAKKWLERVHSKGSAAAHNQAFVDCEYERRFREQVLADRAALTKLEALSRRAETEDVFLICYEGDAKACHRRILLRIAEEQIGTEVRVDGVEPRAKQTRSTRRRR